MNCALHGKSILITREKNQAKEFSEMIIRHGGKPVEAPLLKITCKDAVGNRAILKKLHSYQWIFFTSANGVRCFFQIMKENNISDKQLATSMLAAVGHKTEVALKEFGYEADFIPSTYNAEVMAEEFLARFTADKTVLLVRGNRSRDVLPDTFHRNNITFDTIEVYETTYNVAIRSKLQSLLSEQSIDFITFTSPSTVEAFMEMNLKHVEKIKRLPCVCIGTTTQQKAEVSGFVNTLIPMHFTIEGMLESISNYIVQEG
ncbi:uroporphyrinogen-III synthase [Virgibacillus sp. FSP13]